MNLKEVKQTLVTELKAYAKAHGLNRRDLAHKLQTTRSIISRVMDPENESLNFEILMRIARLVDLHIEITLDDKEEESDE